ncbi:cytotoxic translational repressor of toxin-antitoxin stability system [Leptolyngbya sp. PCC 7375]|nr:cytotoxic translational repressor of toxin-antitoxin stability system [Leptolyngbya sp. PCC 7375]
MPDQSSPIRIELAPTFQRQLKTLAKRYRNIRKDIEPITQQLAAGHMIGIQVPSIDYPVYKVRIKNSDIQKGKSAGYRLIYYLKAADLIILLTIYSKADQANISTSELEHILTEM